MMAAPARSLPTGSPARPHAWRGPRWRRRLTGAALSTLLYVVLAIFFIPTLWIVLTSLRPNVEINASPPVWIPHSLTLDSFRALFSPGLNNESVPFTSYLTNSVVVALVSTGAALTTGTLAGYAFSRFRFRGDTLLFLGLMLARGVPGVALGLPLFVIAPDQHDGSQDVPGGTVRLHVGVHRRLARHVRHVGGHADPRRGLRDRRAAQLDSGTDLRRGKVAACRGRSGVPASRGPDD